MGLAAAAGILLAVAGCGKDGSKTQGPVVLKVNDKAYTAADLEREIGQDIRRGSPGLQAFLATKDGQKQFVDRLLRQELLVQEAEKRKLGDKPEVADQVTAFRRQLLIRSLLQEEIGDKVKVEDKDVQEYYNSHPDEFSGDQVHVRHILVPTEDEAKQILDRLAKNEPFEELAKKYSRDTQTAQKGGELNYFTREQMVPEFAKAAFALKPDEVGGPVKTAFGYHVIKMIDRKKGQPMTFDQVKDQLRQRLLEERQNARFTAWIAELEKSAKITREEGLLPVGHFGPPVPAAPGAAPPESKAGDKSQP
jgi:peptidyl-prolyl cis-trans isomerase C